MASKNTTTAPTIAERLADLRVKVTAAQAEADTARYAAASLTARVAAAEEVSAEEWRDLPAAATLADAKLAALRAALDQVEAEATEERAAAFVIEAQAKLEHEPDIEARLSRLAEVVKTELDTIEEEAEAWNLAFAEIYQAALVGNVASGNYGVNTKPVIQAAGLQVDFRGGEKIIYTDGAEHVQVGTFGLVDDVAAKVTMMQAHDRDALAYRLNMEERARA